MWTTITTFEELEIAASKGLRARRLSYSNLSYSNSGFKNGTICYITSDILGYNIDKQTIEDLL